MNVLRGEMSLVGPRPEQPEFVDRLERMLPFYQRRHLMRPGITGWAQVRCGYAGSDIGSAWKLCHDLYYAKHRSTAVDLLILVRDAGDAVLRARAGDAARRTSHSCSPMSADRDITAANGSIAVVIPCHDDGATLEEAVGSVRAQDVPAEIIVVDDGSSDAGDRRRRSTRVAAAGARVLRQDNRGPGPARMAGLRATGAEYALPLDADDRLLPGALRLLRDELERNPRAVAAWGSARHFGGLDFVQPSLPSLDAWQLTYQNHLPLSALYRREAVLDAGGWQLDGGYEDWDLWLSLAEAGFEGVGIRASPASTGSGRAAGSRDSSSRHAERCAALRERHPAAVRRAASPPARVARAATAQAGAPASSTRCPCPPTASGCSPARRATSRTGRACPRSRRGCARTGSAVHA